MTSDRRLSFAAKWVTKSQNTPAGQFRHRHFCCSALRILSIAPCACCTIFRKAYHPPRSSAPNLDQGSLPQNIPTPYIYSIHHEAENRLRALTRPALSSTSTAARVTTSPARQRQSRSGSQRQEDCERVATGASLPPSTAAMESSVRRRDTTKGPPLRILTLGRVDRSFGERAKYADMVQMAEESEDTPCSLYCKS